MNKIVALLIAVSFMGAGCTNAVAPRTSPDAADVLGAPGADSWNTYQTEAYSISYPKNFTLTPKNTLLWTTIKSSDSSEHAGSIEIWSKLDLPERPIGYSGAIEEAVLPIFEGEAGVGLKNVQQVRVWNYSGDAETTKALMDILATMNVK